MATKVHEDKSGGGDELAANDTSLGSPQSRETFPFLVLKNIFAYSNSPKICRQVCRKWNTAINEIGTGMSIIIDHIADFIKLITENEAQLQCKTVTIWYRIDPLDPITTLFLETCGNEIENLKFDWGIKLSSSPLLSVSQSCQNLTDVELNTEEVATIETPTDHKSSGQNPFPRLTSLTIRGIIPDVPEPIDSDAAVARADFIIMLLRRAVKLRKLTLNTWEFCNWTKLSNNAAVTTELQRLDTIHLEFFDFKVDLVQDLWNPQLNLKILEIVLVINELMTEQFSSLLQHMSGTLEELAICSISRDGMGIIDTEINYLTFPCKMTKLKTLKLRSGGYTRIVCSAPDTAHNQNDNVFQLLPSLTYFQQKYHIHFLLKEQILDCPVFWENLFAMKPSSEKSPIDFIHKNLTEIQFDYKIDSDNIVNNMAHRFPQLTKCSLKATKDQFQEIITLMKDHKIRKLTLTYVQRDGEGIHDFTSAISGFSLEQCTNNAELEYEGESQTELLKIRPSLSDWKYLSDLTIWIHWGSDPTDRLKFDYFTLNNLCAQVFANLKQIKRLSLRRFKMESKHIVTILENVPITFCDLWLCPIEDWNSNKDALEALRLSFPRVQLIGFLPDSYNAHVKYGTKLFKSEDRS